MRGFLGVGAHGEERRTLAIGDAVAEVDGMIVGHLNPKAIDLEIRQVDENSAVSYLDWPLRRKAPYAPYVLAAEATIKGVAPPVRKKAPALLGA